MATVTLPKLLANFETSLAAQMSATATTLTLNVSVDGDAVSLSGLYALTLDEGTATEEHMLVTLTGAAGVVSKRGLSKVNFNTEVTANKFIHNRGASVKITDAALLLVMRLLNGDDTFNAVNLLGINSVSGLATPTAGETTKAANVAYVNAISLAGVADMSEIGKGVGEQATQTEIETGDSTGTTTAPTVMTPASWLPTWKRLVTNLYTYGDTISAGNALYLNTSTTKLLRALTGTQAVGTLTWTANANNNETVVLGATTYTYKNVLTGAANEVLIGATTADSITNLKAAINAEAGAGTLYGTGTVANASASCTSVTATTNVVAALSAGTAGNSIASTETLTNGSWGGATLSGGAIGGSPADNFFGIAIDAGVDTDTLKRVQVGGVVDGLSGLTAGFQYLSDTTKGGLTATPSTTYRKPVGFAPNTTTMLILPTSPAEYIEALNFFANTDFTATEAETLTSSAGSDADALHTHPDLVRGLNFTRMMNTSAAGGNGPSSGFSDATNDSVTVAVYDSTNDVAWANLLEISVDAGGGIFVKQTDNESCDATSSAATVHPLHIGLDIWVAETAPAVIQKNDTNVTFSGTARTGPLGHDNTNSLLLVLYSTTLIAKFSGIAGTTITNTNADVTLDTAVSQTGFAYDDLFDRYVCVDLTNNLLRKFNSSGVTVETAAYTVTDGTVMGVCIIGERYHLVMVNASTLSALNITEMIVSFIPTTMRRS